jgi:hypothetical protein
MRFTAEEDDQIRAEVLRTGPRRWNAIADLIPNRTARQIRERWKNYLAPEINVSPWTADEDDLITRLVAEMGKQWSRMAQFFRSRTDVAIKNRFILIQRRQRRAVRKAAALLPEQARRELAQSMQSRAILPGIIAILNDRPKNTELQEKRESDDFRWGDIDVEYDPTFWD